MIYNDPTGLKCCCAKCSPCKHYACCSKFERFYDVFAPVGAPIGQTAGEKAEACANSLLNGAWWQRWGGSAGGGASLVVGACAGAVWGGPIGFLVGLNLVLAQVNSYTIAYAICSSFVCTSNDFPSSVCSVGAIWTEQWACRCLVGSTIYKPSSTGRYSSPPTGPNSIIIPRFNLHC